MAKNKQYYFLGVSTSHSLVNSAFPIWMSLLNAEVELVGYNLPLNANEKEYDVFLNHIRRETTVGALVTTHKANLFKYSEQKFDNLSTEARLLREISAVRYDSDRKLLIGHNTDIESCKRSLLNLTIHNKKWLTGDRSIVVLGAGGSGLSLISAVQRFVPNYGRLVITEVDLRRMEVAKKVVESNNFPVSIEDASKTEEVISTAGRAPLIINATGMGKDIDGSPVENIRCFPRFSIFWELNYRGELPLYHNLRRDSNSHGFCIEDGWEFFLDGWMNNIIFALNLSQTNLNQDRFRNAVRDLRPSE